ncbi:MAG: hypothetical protein ACLFP2_01450 [Candidatus Woesearchaeota archaeon]
MRPMDYLKGMAFALMVTSAVTGCNDKAFEQGTKEVAERSYPVLETKVPAGATLSGYIANEDMSGRLGYDTLSDVIRSVNDEYGAFMHDKGRVVFREGRDVRLPDYNRDGKVWGQEAEDTGLELVVGNDYRLRR